MEAMVILLDVGPSMSSQRPVCVPPADRFDPKHQHQDHTHPSPSRPPYHHPSQLDAALACVERLALRKLFSDNRRRSHFALVLFNTAGSDNRLGDRSEEPGAYRHVTVWRRMAPVDWQMVRMLRQRDLCEPILQADEGSDWLEAVLVALDYFQQQSTIHKYSESERRLILLTDFGSGREADCRLIETVSSALCHLSVELNIIGSACQLIDNKSNTDRVCDCGIKITAHQTSRLQRSGEEKVARLIAAIRNQQVHLSSQDTEEDDGETIAFSFSTALSQLGHYLSRKQTSQAWRSIMQLGNDLILPVVAYAAIREAELPPSKRVFSSPTVVRSAAQAKVVKRTSDALDGGSAASSAHSLSVISTPNAPSSAHLVSVSSAPNAASPAHSVTVSSAPSNPSATPNEATSSLKLGSVSVSFNKDDPRVLSYHNPSDRSLHLLGFTSTARVPCWLYAGRQTLYVYSDGQQVAFASLVAALAQLNMCAIGRRTYNRHAVPRLGALFPPPSGATYLIWIELPYSDDIVTALFDSLSDAGTEEQQTAMNLLLDSMNLEPDENSSLLNSECVSNPQIQQFYHVIAHNILSKSCSSSSVPLPPIPRPEALLKDQTPSWFSDLSPDVVLATDRLRSAFGECKFSIGKPEDNSDAGESFDPLTGVVWPNDPLSSFRNRLKSVMTMSEGRVNAILALSRSLCTTLNSIVVGDHLKKAPKGGSQLKPVDQWQKIGDAMSALRQLCFTDADDRKSGLDLWFGVASIYNQLLLEAELLWPLSRWPLLCLYMVENGVLLVTADGTKREQIKSGDIIGVVTTDEAERFARRVRQYAGVDS